MFIDMVQCFKRLENEIKRNCYSVAFCPEIKQYLLIVEVTWIASYEAFYVISKDDYELCKENQADFEVKYKLQIGRGGYLLTSEIGGSFNRRDYDNNPRYHPGEGNPFQHHNFLDGIFWMRFLHKDTIYLIPPAYTLPQKIQVKCRCSYTWEFDDSKIPVDAKYEVICPECGMSLMRKKTEQTKYIFPLRNKYNLDAIHDDAGNLIAFGKAEKEMEDQLQKKEETISIRQERQMYANKISNRIIPRLLESGIMEECKW